MRFELSTNGTEWEKPQLQANGEAGVIDYLFTKPAKAKSMRISQLGETPGTFWSIHELDVLGAVKRRFRICTGLEFDDVQSIRMSIDVACQTFELKRFPELKDPSVRIWLFSLAFFAFKHWLLALAIVSLVVIFVFWRLRSPVECLRLSDKEIHMALGWSRFIRIDKQLVEEVSPASKGVIIAWKKSGVPIYTELRSSWFSEEVWQRAYPALLTWGATKECG